LSRRIFYTGAKKAQEKQLTLFARLGIQIKFESQSYTGESMKNNSFVEATYHRLKLGKIAMLAGALLIGQIPTIEAKSPKHCPINIGYPNGISPVPLTPDCLLPILIPGRTTTIHSGSVVEPSIAVNPKDCDRIVACWQQSRIFNGGSLEVGIA
jgi:hypothetical protein